MFSSRFHYLPKVKMLTIDEFMGHFKKLADGKLESKLRSDLLIPKIAVSLTTNP